MSIDYTVSEISARSPDMSEKDFRAFLEDVRANGQLVPIWVRGTEVIDGRKRLAACRELGIAPRIINLDPTQDADAIARALNVLRTHYTIGQRGMFGSEKATRQRGYVKPVVAEFSDHSVGQLSAQEAADQVGVAVHTIKTAKQIRSQGAIEVVEAVKAGRLTLHAAKQIVNLVPKEEQPAAVEKVIAANKGKPRNTPIAKVLTGIDPRRDRAVPNPKHEQFALAIQKLDVGAEIIAKYAEVGAQDIRRKEFLEALRHVRTTISRVINLLEIAA